MVWRLSQHHLEQLNFRSNLGPWVVWDSVFKLTYVFMSLEGLGSHETEPQSRLGLHSLSAMLFKA